MRGCHASATQSIRRRSRTVTELFVETIGSMLNNRWCSLLRFIHSEFMTNDTGPHTSASTTPPWEAEGAQACESGVLAAMRSAAIKHTMDVIKTSMTGDGSHRDHLVNAERALAELASQSELFGRAAFPAPTDTVDRNFLVSQDDDGTFALYVSTGKPGVVYQPHDHGGTWAAVAAVSGAQHHSFYSTDTGSLERVGSAVCEPGTTVSVPTDGIHSIEGGPDPLVHLHLYGLGFEHQHLRREFDPDTFAERRFRLEDLSFIEDRRPSEVTG